MEQEDDIKRVYKKVSNFTESTFKSVDNMVTRYDLCMDPMEDESFNKVSSTKIPSEHARDISDEDVNNPWEEYATKSPHQKRKLIEQSKFVVCPQLCIV